MALNVTTAVFRPGFNIATASPSLVQWDQGQTLQFEGVELPSAYQVEFTNAVTVQAITMIGNENGVEIPNELLQQSFPITAYIVLHETAEDRETEYWATIYVKARQKPREETPDPEQSSVIDQTIAALQEGVAEAQAASQAVQNMGVEAETLPEGSEATVEKTVDPETGEVTLEFGIPEGRHGATGATPDIQIGTVTTGAPGSQADASITGTREEPRLNLTIPQGPQGDAGVISVNGKTGAVTLDATDVGAKPASYEAPVSSVNGKTGAVVLDASDVGAKPANYEAPVSSVNGRTGAVVLDASDVGAKPASYEAPVSSVNEKTGAVVLDAGDIGYESTTVEDELGTINSALSSLSAVTEIIDTASGAIASFPDGSGLPMRSLVAQINPVQDLHGYDAPWPAGGGKNKFQINATTQTIDGVTFTINADGTVSCSGTASSTISFDIGTVALAGGTSYILNGCPSGGSTSTYLLSFPGIGYDAGSGYTYTPSADATPTVRITVYSGVNMSGKVFSPMVRLSTESDATFAPYSNICPISGWTGLSGQRTGKNLLDDSIKTQNATYIYFNSTGLTTDKTITLPAGTYTITVVYSEAYASTKAHINVYRVNPYERLATAYNAIKLTFTLTKTEDILIWMQNTGLDLSCIVSTMLVQGSDTADYEPYTGEAISVTFPTTVYGGSDDVISGQGTSTMGMVDLGTLTFSLWNSTSVRDCYSFLFADIKPQSSNDENINALSTIFVATNYNASWNPWQMSYTNTSKQVVFIVPHGKYATPQDFATAMSGVMFCYELATPQTFTHTGQLVDTLVGQNNVFVDTGDVTVTYQASIKGYIDKVLAS